MILSTYSERKSANYGWFFANFLIPILLLLRARASTAVIVADVKMRSLLAYYADAVMAVSRGAGCALDCSGRGDCMNGTCLCEIRFSGNEYRRGVPRGFFRVRCAAHAVYRDGVPAAEGAQPASRFQGHHTEGALSRRVPRLANTRRLFHIAFSIPGDVGDEPALRLLSVFHLRDVLWERQRFLSKSFLAFVTFNVISYSLLFAESFYQHVFNGCYAVLLFIVVIFFLIYGVEVYFKLRGEFLRQTKVCTIITPRPGPSTAADGEDVKDTLVKQNVETDSLVGSVGSSRDCWICYDGSRQEPLIRPCRCTGDVAAVHHDCLKRWLIESYGTPDCMKCKVCNTPYVVEETNRLVWERGFTCVHFLRTILAFICMSCTGLFAWVIVQFYPTPVTRVLCTGGALLICYVAARYLGINTLIAYRRARVASIRIVTEQLDQTNEQLSTISKTVTVDIASKNVLELKDVK
ncbi:unnamed protein product [Leptidea sinapis]|uniref:RING-CH-type domain-containing protein n=1 Tax=Leptidea sinapis TaxID=189913 RepID=A0A5E4PZ67_9NEOP|nr:unnamed protein product [Leptidea sinapis]